MSAVIIQFPSIDYGRFGIFADTDRQYIVKHAILTGIIVRFSIDGNGHERASFYVNDVPSGIYLRKLAYKVTVCAYETTIWSFDSVTPATKEAMLMLSQPPGQPPSVPRRQPVRNTRQLI